jgi:hypothetical protein
MGIISREGRDLNGAISDGRCSAMRLYARFVRNGPADNTRRFHDRAFCEIVVCSWFGSFVGENWPEQTVDDAGGSDVKHFKWRSRIAGAPMAFALVQWLALLARGTLEQRDGWLAFHVSALRIWSNREWARAMGMRVGL